MSYFIIFKLLLRERHVLFDLEIATLDHSDLNGCFEIIIQSLAAQKVSKGSLGSLQSVLSFKKGSRTMNYIQNKTLSNFL